MERRAALTNITDAEVMVIDVSRDRLVCLLAQRKKGILDGRIEFDSPLFMKEQFCRQLGVTQRGRYGK